MFLHRRTSLLLFSFSRGREVSETKQFNMHFWFRRVTWFIEKISLKEAFPAAYLEPTKTERKFAIGRDSKPVEHNLIPRELTQIGYRSRFDSRVSSEGAVWNVRHHKISLSLEATRSIVNVGSVSKTYF